MENGKLLVSSEQKGAAVALPLMLVWNKKSLGEQRIWRPLSVTTDRAPVPTHEAFAVRVPHDGNQLIVFDRSLAHVDSLSLGIKHFMRPLWETSIAREK